MTHLCCLLFVHVKISHQTKPKDTSEQQDTLCDSKELVTVQLGPCLHQPDIHVAQVATVCEFCSGKKGHCHVQLDWAEGHHPAALEGH